MRCRGDCSSKLTVPIFRVEKSLAVTLISQFLAVYLVVQLMTLAALPLATRFFAVLPDRGFSCARLLGILLTGYILWLGYSFGILRNEIGGAWLAFGIVAGISAAAWWSQHPSRNDRVEAEPNGAVGRSRRALRQPILPSWRYILIFELLFLIAFAAWAWVRAYDPAANHTEQPMDLMFMNSIRASATYPPQDAWLAGYPISYYYFGYWMLNMVGLMAGQSPAIVYNLGQACWYGLLISGAFGVSYNLLAVGRRFWTAVAGGFVGALLVGMAANFQGLLEWLHANGVDVTWLATWLGVRGFPQDAAVTNLWHVGFGWWWWRASRVLADTSLRGDHIEVIDEFPVFSYILGDNHPHVTAMPFALLAVAAALAIFLHSPLLNGDGRWWGRLRAAVPLGVGGYALLSVITGSLLFINTWDYPPYWLLTVTVLAAVLLRPVGAMRARPASSEISAVSAMTGATPVALAVAGESQRILPAFGMAALAGVALMATSIVLYLPYFLTAQSQANGLIPNLFHPTRFSQFVAMFATALLLLAALLVLAWPTVRPNVRTVGMMLTLTVLLPAALLALLALLVSTTEGGRGILAGVALPDGATSHLPFIVERWSGQPFTFLVVGVLAAFVLALVWNAVHSPRVNDGASTLLFTLMLAAIGLGLVLVPEVVYLRDNFGWRMNTIFKFYYQAWLLFGIAGAYTVVTALAGARGRGLLPAILSGAGLVLAIASTVYLVAGAYSKANGFAGDPTFDATAYLARTAPAESGAVAWIAANTRPDDVVVEGKGRSYGAETNRISTMTGRPTPLGWEGHEAQWRGRAYGAMAAGRPEALKAIYGGTTPGQLPFILASLNASYVYVGPSERSQYGLTPAAERSLFAQLEMVYDNSDVRIYRVPPTLLEASDIEP